MRHQKGRRDCSYKSSLRCLSFTRCLSAILWPIFLKSELHPFFLLAESAVWLSSLPCCCLPAPLPLSPLEAHPDTKARGSWLCLFSNPTHPAAPVPCAPWAKLCPLRVPGSMQAWWQLPVQPPSPWHTQLVGEPGERGPWLVPSSLSFLLRIL